MDILIRDERSSFRSLANGADAHLHRLVKVQRNHFLHAVLDHLRGEEVRFSLFVNGDLPEVFQQDGADGLGGVGHVDGPVVAHHLAHVGQRATVVQVEMAGDGPGEAVSGSGGGRAEELMWQSPT